MQRFRGELVLEAHRRLYHSILGLRVLKNKREVRSQRQGGGRQVIGLGHGPLSSGYGTHKTVKRTDSSLGFQVKVLETF